MESTKPETRNPNSSQLPVEAEVGHSTPSAASGLRPCPFCGYDAELNDYSGKDEPEHVIECTNCGAIIAGGDATSTIASWNRRTGPKFGIVEMRLDTRAVVKYLDELAGCGAGLIYGERIRQIQEKGFTPEHDDQHADESLADAARFILGYDHVRVSDPECSVALGIAKRVLLKHQGDRLRQLAIAGALIAAEIDRLKRAASINNQQSIAP